MNKIMLPFVIIGGWCLPGFAHWYYGHRYKALALFAIIMTCLVLGLVLSDFRGIKYADNPFCDIPQYGCGLALLLDVFLTSRTPLGLIRLPYFEIGLLYICAGGLLNLLAVLNLVSQLTTPKPESEVPAGVVEPVPPRETLEMGTDNKEQQ